MNFEEYAAKPILAAAGIAVPRSQLAATSLDAGLAADKIGPCVVKAQVPTGKQFDVKMFGSKGVLMYGGEDLKPDSGRLELRLHDGTIEIKEGFYMENLEQGGTGIESLQQFVNACRGKPYKI